MRGDQPVVSAASWMVRASTRPNLTTLLSRFPRGGGGGGGRAALRRLGRQQDRLPALVLALVQAHGGDDRLVGALEAREDLVERHLVVARPRRLDVDLGAGGGLPAGARDRRPPLGLGLGLADPGGLATRRAGGALARRLGGGRLASGSPRPWPGRLLGGGRRDVGGVRGRRRLATGAGALRGGGAPGPTRRVGGVGRGRARRGRRRGRGRSLVFAADRRAAG